jgi:hypothetical protein
MITQERAQEIKRVAQDLATGSPWVDQLDNSMTPVEKEEVKAYWQSLPESASFAEAFFDYLNGTVGELG